MKVFLMLAGMAIVMTGTGKAEPVLLSTYADANGVIDVVRVDDAGGP